MRKDGDRYVVTAFTMDGKYEWWAYVAWVWGKKEHEPYCVGHGEASTEEEAVADAWDTHRRDRAVGAYGVKEWDEEVNS